MLSPFPSPDGDREGGRPPESRVDRPIVSDTGRYLQDVKEDEPLPPPLTVLLSFTKVNRQLNRQMRVKMKTFVERRNLLLSEILLNLGIGREHCQAKEQCHLEMPSQVI